jgi:hypothetical protein
MTNEDILVYFLYIYSHNTPARIHYTLDKLKDKSPAVKQFMELKRSKKNTNILIKGLEAHKVDFLAWMLGAGDIPTDSTIKKEDTLQDIFRKLKETA